jgi:hypothetical protein
MEDQLWKETIQENIFIICKTPMAKSITKRTLVGFKNIVPNATYFDDLNNQMRNKSKQFIERISRANYWNKKGAGKLKFDAVVGNPPYQENISSEQGNTSLSRQLFPVFIQNSILLGSQYVSLITPSRWFTGDAQDKSFIKLRDFIRENNHISKIYNYHSNTSLFSDVEIAGGVNYFLYDNKLDDENIEFTEVVNETRNVSKRPLFEDGIDIVISMNRLVSILHKVKNHMNFVSMTDITYGRNAFGVVGKTSLLNKITTQEYFRDAVEVRCAYEQIRYISKTNIKKNVELLNKWKVFTSKANGGAGVLSDAGSVAVIGKAYIGKPLSICTDSLIPIGSFNTKTEAVNLQKYMTCKFLRFMIGILKVSQNLYQNVYQFVPLQDFTDKSDIDWTKSIKEIDLQLYRKYDLSAEEIDYIENKIKEME